MFIEGEKQNKAESRKQKVESGKTEKQKQRERKGERGRETQTETSTTTQVASPAKTKKKAADLHVVPAAATDAADVVRSVVPLPPPTATRCRPWWWFLLRLRPVVAATARR